MPKAISMDGLKILNQSRQKLINQRQTSDILNITSNTKLSKTNRLEAPRHRCERGHRRS